MEEVLVFERSSVRQNSVENVKEDLCQEAHRITGHINL